MLISMNELQSSSKSETYAMAADRLSSVEHVILRAETAKKQLMQLKLFLKETFDDYICTEEDELPHHESSAPPSASSSEELDCDRLLKLHSTQSPDECPLKSIESTNLESEGDISESHGANTGQTVIRTDNSSTPLSDASLLKPSKSPLRAPESSSNSPPPSSPSSSSVINSNINEDKGQSLDEKVNNDSETSKAASCIATSISNPESAITTAKPMEISPEESQIKENVQENSTENPETPQTITLDDLPSPQDMKDLSSFNNICKALMLPFSGPATPNTPSTPQPVQLVSPAQNFIRPSTNVQPASPNTFLSPESTIFLYKKDYMREISLYQAQVISFSSFSKYLQPFENTVAPNSCSMAKALVLLSFKSIAKSKGWSNLLDDMFLRYPDLDLSSRAILICAAAHYVRFSPDRKSATEEILASLSLLVHHHIQRRSLVYEIISIISPFIYMSEFFVPIFSILKSLHMKPEIETKQGCAQCYGIVIAFCSSDIHEDWIAEIFKVLTYQNDALHSKIDRVIVTFLIPSVGCYLLMFRKTERFFLRVLELVSNLPNLSSEKHQYLQVLTRLMSHLFAELTITMGLNETLTKLRIDSLPSKQLTEHLNYAQLILKSFMNSPNWTPSMQNRIDKIFEGFLNSFTLWLEDHGVFCLLIHFILKTKYCLGEPFVDRVIKPFIIGHPLICQVINPPLIDAIVKLTLKNDFPCILPFMFPISHWVQRIVQESPKIINLTFICEELSGPPISCQMQTDNVQRCLHSAAYLVLKSNFRQLEATIAKFCVPQMSGNEINSDILAPL